MTIWTSAALGATLALALCGLAIARGSIATRLVALQLASAAAAIDLLSIAQSFGNESAYDLALASALLSFPAGLIYARFYGRWL
jgi:multisubunit Na+/H+ antiporter MnhF subunit